jgi:hypothetical protein
VVITVDVPPIDALATQELVRDAGMQFAGDVQSAEQGDALSAVMSSGVLTIFRAVVGRRAHWRGQ